MTPALAHLIARIPSATQALSAAVRDLAGCDASDPVLHAGVMASVQTLNQGVSQQTALCAAYEMQRKHRSRLRAALLAMADALAAEEGSDD